eukprot:PhM_4_TR16730/c0_g1_i1/m.30418
MYVALLRDLEVVGCATSQTKSKLNSDVPVENVYDFEWEVTPSGCTSVPSSSTKEPHFYCEFGGINGVTFSEAQALCHNKTFAGYRGYLATLADAAEQAAMKSPAGKLLSKDTKGTATVWVGAQGSSSSSVHSWHWSSPASYDCYQPLVSRTEPSSSLWCTGNPKQTSTTTLGAVFDTSCGALRSEPNTTLHNVLCEFGGGPSSTFQLRGALRYTDRKTPCGWLAGDDAAWSLSADPGLCVGGKYQQMIVQQTSDIKKEVAPFGTSTDVNIVLSALAGIPSTQKVSSLTIGFAPDLCEEPTYTRPANVFHKISRSKITVQSSSTSLALSVYAAIIPTVRFSTCVRSAAAIHFDTYDISWNIAIDAPKFEHWMTHTEHYFEAITSEKLPFDKAIAACTQRTLFGHVGALSSAEAIAANDVLRRDKMFGWIALSNQNIVGNDWVWRRGLSAGTAALWLNWGEGEPKSYPFGSGVQIVETPLAGKWSAVSLSYTEQSYSCEFGGLSGNVDTRGVSRYVVVSTPSALLPETTESVFISHPFGKNVSYKVFSSTSKKAVLHTLHPDKTKGIEKFLLEIAPSPCSELVFENTSSLIIDQRFVNTSYASVTISGSASTADYQTALASLRFPMCVEGIERRQKFELKWKVTLSRETGTYKYSAVTDGMEEDANSLVFYRIVVPPKDSGNASQAQAECSRDDVLGRVAALASFTGPHSVARMIDAHKKKNAALFPADSAFVVRVCGEMRNLRSRKFEWMCGPEKYSNVYPPPSTTSSSVVSDQNNACMGLNITDGGAKWEYIVIPCSSSSVPLPFMCKHKVRKAELIGTITVFTTTAPCADSGSTTDGTATSDYLGDCNTLHIEQLTKTSSKHKLFTSATTPTMMRSGGSLKIRGFVVDIQPAACVLPIVPSLDHNITATSNTTSQLMLIGVATVDQYYTILSEIEFQTCSQPGRHTQRYTITWEYLPNIGFYRPSGSVFHHFYVATMQDFQKRDFDNAVSTCEREAIFGLAGYLATVGSKQEFEFIRSMLVSDAEHWVSAHAQSALGPYYTVTGPEPGQLALPFTDVPLSDEMDDDDSGSCYLVLGNTSQAWHRVCGKQSASSRSYVCEYSSPTSTVFDEGNPDRAAAPLSFRGRLYVSVHTQPCLSRSKFTGQAYQGDCFAAPALYTLPSEALVSPVFSPGVLGSVIQSTTENILSLTVEVQPSLCQPMFVVAGDSSSDFSVTDNTTSKLGFKKETMPKSYVDGVLSHLYFKTCSTPSKGIEVTYDFSWSMVPASANSFTDSTETMFLSSIVAAQVAPWTAAGECLRQTLLGYDGYLPTPKSSAAVKAFASFFAEEVWVGATRKEPATSTLWSWAGGPYRGTAPSNPQFTVAPTTRQLYAAVAPKDADGKWVPLEVSNVELSNKRPYACQFGGTQPTATTRGSVQVLVSVRDTCATTPWWGYSGGCTVKTMHQFPGKPQDVYVMRDLVTTMIREDAHLDVVKFTLSVEPALCNALQVTLNSTSAPNVVLQQSATTTSLELSGKATVKAYKNIVDTIHFKNCDSTRKSEHDYTFTWRLVPDDSAVIAYETVTTKERRYMIKSKDGETRTWEDAKKACNDMTLFGYEGYLATISNEHANAFFSSQKLNGWIGASCDEVEFETKSTLRWLAGGPEHDLYVGYSNFNTSSSSPSSLCQSGSNGVVGMAVVFDGTTQKWALASKTEKRPYVCSFGGTSLAVDHYGSLKFHVRTSSITESITLSQSISLSTSPTGTKTPSTSPSLSLSTTESSSVSPTSSHSGSVSESWPTHTPSLPATPTTTPTSTHAATRTHTSSPTSTDSLTSTFSRSPSKETPTLTASDTESVSLTMTPSESNTPTPSDSITGTLSPSKNTVSSTQSTAVTETVSPTMTSTLMETLSYTFSKSNVETESSSLTLTLSKTASVTPSAGSASISSDYTVSRTSTASFSSTVSYSEVATMSHTATQSQTSTKTLTPTPTLSVTESTKPPFLAAPPTLYNTTSNLSAAFQISFTPHRFYFDDFIEWFVIVPIGGLDTLTPQHLRDSNVIFIEPVALLDRANAIFHRVNDTAVKVITKVFSNLSAPVLNVSFHMRLEISHPPSVPYMFDVNCSDVCASFYPSLKASLHGDDDINDISKDEHIGDVVVMRRGDNRVRHFSAVLHDLPWFGNITVNATSNSSVAISVSENVTRSNLTHHYYVLKDTWAERNVVVTSIVLSGTAARQYVWTTRESVLTRVIPPFAMAFIAQTIVKDGIMTVTVGSNMTREHDGMPVTLTATTDNMQLPTVNVTPPMIALAPLETQKFQVSLTTPENQRRTAYIVALARSGRLSDPVFAMYEPNLTATKKWVSCHQRACLGVLDVEPGAPEFTLSVVPNDPVFFDGANDDVGLRVPNASTYLIATTAEIWATFSVIDPKPGHSHIITLNQTLLHYDRNSRTNRLGHADEYLNALCRLIPVIAKTSMFPLVRKPFTFVLDADVITTRPEYPSKRLNVSIPCYDPLSLVVSDMLVAPSLPVLSLRASSSSITGRTVSIGVVGNIWDHRNAPKLVNVSISSQNTTLLVADANITFSVTHSRVDIALKVVGRERGVATLRFAATDIGSASALRFLSPTTSSTIRSNTKYLDIPVHITSDLNSFDVRHMHDVIFGLDIIVQLRPNAIPLMTLYATVDICGSVSVVVFSPVSSDLKNITIPSPASLQDIFAQRFLDPSPIDCSVIVTTSGDATFDAKPYVGTIHIQPPPRMAMYSSSAKTIQTTRSFSPDTLRKLRTTVTLFNDSLPINVRAPVKVVVKSDNDDDPVSSYVPNLDSYGGIVVAIPSILSPGDLLKEVSWFRDGVHLMFGPSDGVGFVRHGATIDIYVSRKVVAVDEHETNILTAAAYHGTNITLSIGIDRVEPVTTSTVATMIDLAAGASVLGGMPSVLYAGRVRAVLWSIQCPAADWKSFQQDTTMDLLVSPMQLSIGSGGPNNFVKFVGTSIGNASFMVIVFVFHIICCVVYAVWDYTNAGIGSVAIPMVSFYNAMASLRFPSASILVALFLLQSQLSSTMVVILHGATTIIGLCVACVIVSVTTLTAIIALILHIVHNSGKHVSFSFLDEVEHHGLFALGSWFPITLERSTGHVDSVIHKTTLLRAGWVYEFFVWNCNKFLLVEIGLSVGFAVVDAFEPSTLTLCAIRECVFCALWLIHAVLVLWLRPHNAKMDIYTLGAASILAAMSSVFIIAAQLTDDPEGSVMLSGVSFAFISICIMVIRCGVFLVQKVMFPISSTHEDPSNMANTIVFHFSGHTSNETNNNKDDLEMGLLPAIEGEPRLSPRSRMIVVDRSAMARNSELLSLENRRTRPTSYVNMYTPVAQDVLEALVRQREEEIRRRDTVDLEL